MIEASHAQQQMIATSVILASDSDPVLKSVGVLSDQIALPAELRIVSPRVPPPYLVSYYLTNGGPQTLIKESRSHSGSKDSPKPGVTLGH